MLSVTIYHSYTLKQTGWPRARGSTGAHKICKSKRLERKWSELCCVEKFYELSFSFDVDLSISGLTNMGGSSVAICQPH